MPLVERPLSKGKSEVHCLPCPCAEGSASVLATVFLFRAARRGSSLFLMRNASVAPRRDSRVWAGEPVGVLLPLFGNGSVSTGKGQYYK